MSHDDNPDPKLIESLIAMDDALKRGVNPLELSQLGNSDSQLSLSRAAQCLVDLNLLMGGNRSLPTEPPPALPFRLGRFELQQVIGVGGSAVVYKALDGNLNRDVAIKVPRAHTLASPELRRRFVNEGSSLAKLEHPHIVPVYEAGESHGVPYIVTAFCTGPTLAQWRCGLDGIVSARLIAEMMRDITSAIAFSHEQGILHRDIKPSNVLLFQDTERSNSNFPYVPRVSDLGLAKLVAPGTDDTLSATVLGTLAYMAPEQARSEKVGTSSDVYSLGALLYFLLSSRPPFQSSGLIETLTQVVDTDPIPPSKFVPQVDHDLETICLKCLQKAENQRYTSAVDLRNDLERYLDGRPIHARRTSRVYQLYRWSLRRPATAIVTLVATLLGIGLLSTVVWISYLDLQYRSELLRQNRQLSTLVNDLNRINEVAESNRQRAEQQASLTNQLIYCEDVQGADEALRRGDFRSAQVHLTRHEFLTDQREFCWKYLHGQVSAPSKSIEVSDQKIWSLDVSPDGRYLVYAGDLSRVVLRDADSHRLIGTWDTEQREINTVRFSSDGAMIATAGDDGRIGLWKMPSGELISYINVKSSAKIYGVEFLPGGRDLAVCGDFDDLLFFNLAGQETASVKLSGALEAIAISPDQRFIAAVATHEKATLVDLVTKSVVWEHHQKKDRFVNLVFSADSKLLLTTLKSGEVLLHHVDSGNTRELRQYNFAVYGITRSETGFACSDGTGAIRLLELESNEKSDFRLAEFDSLKLRTTKTWATHDKRVNAIRFSKEETHIFTGNISGNIDCWKIEQTSSFHQESLASLPTDISDNDSRTSSICPGPQDGFYFSASTFGVQLRQTAHRGTSESLVSDIPCSCCSYDPSAGQLYVGTKDGRVGIVPLNNRSEIKWISLFDSDEVRELAVDLQNRRLLVKSRRDLLKFISLDNWNTLARLENRASFAVSPDGRWYAIGIHGKNEIEIWDASNLQSVHRFPAHESTIRSVKFTPDGLNLFTGGDQLIQQWNVGDWSLRRSLVAHSSAIECIAISNDGKTLASIDHQAIVILWSTSTGQPLLRLEAVKKLPKHIIFTADDRQLLVGNEYGALTVFATSN